jgi:uncharacterized protein (DUF58 family)
MHDFNLVYITLFFVFSLAFSAGPIAVLNIGNLEAGFLRNIRLFAHQEGEIPISITNNSKTTSWSVSIHNEETTVPLPKIKAESSKTLYFPVMPDKRGKFTYGNFYFESKYPLSTARLTKNIAQSYEGFVYPEPKGKSLASFLQEEEMHYGEEKEFDGLREYDGSQRLSHIHWASVAKGEMAVKIFSKETQTPQLAFDFYHAGSHNEARLSQLCLWVLECEKKHLAFSIQMPRKKLNSAKESIDDILQTLSTY